MTTELSNDREWGGRETKFSYDGFFLGLTKFLPLPQLASKKNYLHFKSVKESLKYSSLWHTLLLFLANMSNHPKGNNVSFYWTRWSNRSMDVRNNDNCHFCIENESGSKFKIYVTFRCFHEAIICRIKVINDFYIVIMNFLWYLFQKYI